MTDLLKNNEALLKKPIIFIGTGRSGTTVISEIIFQHEDLAWHSNYQELFPRSALINYVRRVFENKFWRFVKYWNFVGVSKNTRQKWKSLFHLFSGECKRCHHASVGTSGDPFGHVSDLRLLRRSGGLKNKAQG